MYDLKKKYATMLSRMTIREKIGQTVNILANMDEIKENYGSLSNFFEEYPVGGLYIGAQAWLNPDKKYAMDWFIAANHEYQDASKYPLLIVEDMENGPGFLLPELPMLPHLMALGATQSEILAYDYGKSLAYGAHALGVNWLLNPVADLSINPFSPSVNVRALADDPHLVSRLLTKIVKGIEDQGVACCVKHFPGDGMDFREQHAVTSYNSLPKDSWDQSFGKVFKDAFNAGASSVMTGHIALPAIQSEKIDDRYPPATLSKEISTHLLRDELNFEGVLVSDALVMGGFKKHINDLIMAEVACFKAGTDVVLWPSLNYFDAMEVAVTSGEVSIEQLDTSVARILDLKNKTGVLKSEHKYTPFNKDKKIFIETTSRKVAEKSLTLVRNKKELLPINPAKIKSILIIGVAPNDLHYEKMEIMRRGFEELGYSAKLQRNIDYESNGWRDTYTEGNHLIILALSRFPQRPFGAMNFMSPEFFSLWGGLCHGREKTVVVSFGNPYHLNEHFEAAKTYVNAYSFVDDSMQAFVKAVCGEIPFTGTSPVDLSIDNYNERSKRF
mgnify:CR=1 FL=1